MFKNKKNKQFLNEGNVFTQLHGAQVFDTIKPNCVKYKSNVFYKGAILWNSLSANIRNIERYDKFKKYKNNGLYAIFNSILLFCIMNLLNLTLNAP